MTARGWWTLLAKVWRRQARRWDEYARRLAAQPGHTLSAERRELLTRAGDRQIRSLARAAHCQRKADACR